MHVALAQEGVVHSECCTQLVVSLTHAIIENYAHPDYKELLWDYLKIADMGQTHHKLSAAFAMHDTFLREGDMHLTNWAQYVK